MKIAFFSDVYIPYISGVVTSILNFSKKLEKRRHQIFIFTVKPKKKIKKEKNVFYYSGFSISKYPGLRFVIPRFFDIFNKIKEINPDIIHIHAPTFLGWSALLIASMLKIPVVNTYHTYLPDVLDYIPLPKFNISKTMNSIAWSYTKKFYNMSTVVIVPSIPVKKELEKHGIKKKKIVIISNGVDLKKFYPYKKKNENIILHVGRIGYEKRIDVLIKAFNELLKVKKDANLIIAGKGPDLKKLKNYVKKKKISDKVKFLGQIPNNKLPKLYSSANIFATASTMETEGLVILEAMACGLPVVGVNKLAVPYVVKHNENGFIAKVGSYKELAKYMNILLTDKKLNEKFRKNSLKIAKKFSLDNTTTQLESLYKEISIKR